MLALGHEFASARCESMLYTSSLSSVHESTALRPRSSCSCARTSDSLFRLWQGTRLRSLSASDGCRSGDRIALAAHIWLARVIVDAHLHARIVRLVGAGKAYKVAAFVCPRASHADLGAFHVELGAAYIFRQSTRIRHEH